MFRKITSIIMVALPMSCFAWIPGSYVGGGVGADAIDFYEKAYIKQSPDQQRFSAINNTHDGAEGIFGSIFAGYNWSCAQFYIATEANLNASSAKFKVINKEFDHPEKQLAKTEMKILPTWGLSVLPGWYFDETTLFYGRAGYAGGHFSLITSDSSLANKKKTLSGFRYGFGIEKLITWHTAVRFEYNHFIYSAAKVFHVDRSNGAVTPKETRIFPETNQFEFGVVYRFA